jgi:chromatin remodeling complex protein RSC6
VSQGILAYLDSDGSDLEKFVADEEAMKNRSVAQVIKAIAEDQDLSRLLNTSAGRHYLDNHDLREACAQFLAESRPDDGPRAPATKRAKTKVKRVPNPDFMAPVTPDAVLAAIVGEKAIPRTEITKKLWDYIKKNNLQDKVNKREIIADEKLRPIFGKARVTMFEMNKLLQGHLKKA